MAGLANEVGEVSSSYDEGGVMNRQIAHDPSVRFADTSPTHCVGRKKTALLRANVAVAQVRGFPGRERVLLLERREAVLGVGRHPGILGLLQRDVVHPRRVAGEDLLLGGAVGVAKGCEPVL